MSFFDHSQAYPVFLIFTRATGMLLLMPVFSGQMIPRQVRVALAFLLALTLAPVALPGFVLPATWIGGALQIVHELAVGAIMGLASRLIFYALEVAGEYISVAIGLSLSANIDPFTRDRASPANTMLVALSTILFLATNSHLWCLMAFSRSFEIIPPAAAMGNHTADVLMHSTGRIFLIALQIAAPMLAISFLVNLCFATLGRAAPSLNVFVLSFPVQILAGLFLFGLTLTLTAHQIMHVLRQIPELMLEAVH
ncbi:MAG: flagellar biosynthetic protein FliR [Verrucomicrobiota bacterium]